MAENSSTDDARVSRRDIVMGSADLQPPPCFQSQPLDTPEDPQPTLTRAMEI